MGWKQVVRCSVVRWIFFFSSRRRHTRFDCDWSSDVCSSDLGWLSLVYAGRFPAKVRKLVMAGAPVDIAARQSRLSAMAEATPLIMFQSLVNLRSEERRVGKEWRSRWSPYH